MTRSLRRMAPLVWVLALVLALAACSDDKTNGNNNGNNNGGEKTVASLKGKTIGYSIPIGTDPTYTGAMLPGLKAQVEKDGLKVVSTDAGQDVNKQISDIESLLAQNVDALIVSPLAPQAIQAVLEKARKRNIPIIVQETRVGGPYATNFQSTNQEAAKMGAEWIAKNVGANAKVAALEGPPIAEVLVSRNTGFQEGAQGKLQVLAKQAPQAITLEAASQIASGWKQKYGKDLQAVWAFSDLSAMGAAVVLGPNVKVIGMNGAPQGVEAIQKGQLAATYDLQPVKFGKALGWAAEQALLGKQLPKEINVEMTLIDKTNAAQWKSWEAQLAEPYEVKVVDKGGQSFLDTGTPQ